MRVKNKNSKLRWVYRLSQQKRGKRVC